MKEFVNDKEYYDLLNKLGYNRKEIIKIYLYNSLLKMLIYLVVTFVIAILACVILKIILIYYPFLLDKYRIVFDFKAIIYILIILVINIMITLLINSKKIG